MANLRYMQNMKGLWILSKQELTKVNSDSKLSKNGKKWRFRGRNDGIWPKTGGHQGQSHWLPPQTAKRIDSVSFAAFRLRRPGCRNSVAFEFRVISLEHVCFRYLFYITGTLSEDEAPVANVRPVEDIGGRPAAVRVPGQTVYGQLFLTTKVTDWAPACVQAAQDLFLLISIIKSWSIQRKF